MANTSEKYIKMGLGTAIRRLLDVEGKYRSGQRDEVLTTERNLLLLALDRIELDIGWDCDGDGLPDTIEIFKQTAKDSCCRILPGKSKASQNPEAGVTKEVSKRLRRKMKLRG